MCETNEVAAQSWEDVEHADVFLLTWGCDHVALDCLLVLGACVSVTRVVVIRRCPPDHLPGFSASRCKPSRYVDFFAKHISGLSVLGDIKRKEWIQLVCIAPISVYITYTWVGMAAAFKGRDRDGLKQERQRG